MVPESSSPFFFPATSLPSLHIHFEDLSVPGPGDTEESVCLQTAHGLTREAEKQMAVVRCVEGNAGAV